MSKIRNRKRRKYGNFKDYLIEQGINKDHIIKLSIDERINRKYLDPDELDKYIRDLIVDDDKYYLILDEIRVYPLSFSEFFPVFEGTEEKALNEYYTYGGLPLTLLTKTDNAKTSYLKTQKDNV